jgi:multiple sugar transport system ATP-binding protein
MAEVALEGIWKSFPSSHLGSRVSNQRCVAVRNLTLTVSEGELVVLVGPSGCGKTTTLRLIAGLESPDQGTIRLGGRVVNHVPPKARNLALMFQSGALYPHWTVYRNLTFGAKLRADDNWFQRACERIGSLARTTRADEERSKTKNRVQQTARMLGIESLLDRKPGQLSGGERQRVALGRAIVRQPAAFLLDEPLSHLDTPLRLGLRRELKELHLQVHATMLYVTHDQVEALCLGDRIGVMDRGQLHQIGTPQEVYERPRNCFVAGFLGLPGMNFLDGALVVTPRGIQFQGSGIEYSFSPSLSEVSGGRQLHEQLGSRLNQPVVLGVRPEDVLLRPPREGVSMPRARVTFVDWLGDASLIHLEVEKDAAAASGRDAGVSASEFPPRIIAKAEAIPGVRRGDVQELDFRPGRIHLFDGRTKENLAASPAAPAFTA